MNKMKYNDFLDELLTNAKKLKGKYPPISEIVNKEVKLLKIKDIYKLEDNVLKLYLFSTINYSKEPKYRYFIGDVIASQSSDFIVYLTKDLAINNKLRLIQYCLYPNIHRVNLIGLKEINKEEDYPKVIDNFKKLNKKFKEKLEKIHTIIEN
ncbi:MAG: hypothetical protein KGD57_08490 [Candidatus Lokiarchaeota archaeon]|nr:hypothetical protein [Candidatus Lokiarchaeota archaeon]